MGNSQFPAVSNRQFRKLLPSVSDRAALCLHISGKDFHRLFLSVSLDAGDSQNLPGLQGKAEIVQLLCAEFVGIAQILHGENLLPELLRRFFILDSDISSHHQPGDLFQCDISQLVGTDGTAVFQDSQPVAEIFHLIQLVRDEYDRISLFFQIQKLLKQLLRLLGSQNGCRLVQNNNLRTPVHGF